MVSRDLVPMPYQSAAWADGQIINPLGIEPLAGYWSSWVWIVDIGGRLADVAVDNAEKGEGRSLVALASGFIAGSGRANVAYLKPEQIEKVEETLGEILPRYNRLLLTFNTRRFKSDQAAEYAHHGYMRRLGTLKRCIENVFALIPPNTDHIPDRNVLRRTNQYTGIPCERVWRYRQSCLGVGSRARSRHENPSQPRWVSREAYGSAHFV